MTHDFHISETATQTITRDVTQMIHDVLYHRLVRPPSPTSPSCPCDMFRHARFIIDSTFITVPDTADQDMRRQLYHPKAPGHNAMKVQICQDFQCDMSCLRGGLWKCQ